MREYNTSVIPNCLPLEERPIPAILLDYVRTHLPYGYSGAGNHFTCTTYHKAVYIIAESFEAPDGPELMLRWFCCRNTKRYGFEITEVMRQSPAEDLCYWRNMYFTTLSGWFTMYRAEDKKSRGGYYGYNYELFKKEYFNKWQPERLKQAPGIGGYWLNPEFVFTIPRYRFSGWQRKLPVIEYLQQYNANNGIEFFGKLGIMPTKALVSKAAKDGNFRRFLRDNAKDVSIYGSTITLHVYRNRSTTFPEAYEDINSKARASRHINQDVSEAKDLPKHFDRRRIWEYAKSAGPRSYNDYLNAVKYLGLDLNDTKVIFPNDFKRMHDLRINEAHARMAAEDAEKAAAFAKKFAEAAVDYAFANYAKPGDAYVVLIPVANAQLVDEGKALHHCVGKMGYDNKMIQHTSFIAFLRKADEIDKPFVTIEFNIEREKIVQIYGAHDKKPDESIVNWAHTWESAVQKIIKKARKAIGKAAAQGKKEKSIFEYIREQNLAA